MWDNVAGDRILEGRGGYVIEGWVRGYLEGGGVNMKGVGGDSWYDIAPGVGGEII